MRDQIIIEVTKLMDFFNFVEDERVLVINSLTKYEVDNEIMQRKLAAKENNSLVFLIHLSNQELATLNVHDKMGIIIRVKKFIEKNRLMQNVNTREEEMKEEIQYFYKWFKPLFDKDLQTFWYNNDNLIDKEDYDNILAQHRDNHDKFQETEGTLKGEDILNELEDDFDILSQLKYIRRNIPSISFSNCVELEVLA